jgi:hypothetical protein
MGPVSDHYNQLSHYRLGAFPRNQRDQQVEERGASFLRTDARSAIVDGDSGPVTEVAPAVPPCRESRRGPGRVHAAPAVGGTGRNNRGEGARTLLARLGAEDRPGATGQRARLLPFPGSSRMHPGRKVDRGLSRLAHSVLNHYDEPAGSCLICSSLCRRAFFAHGISLSIG